MPVMTFIATDHPRGAAGWFVPAVHAELQITLVPKSSSRESLDLVLATAAAIYTRRLEAALDVLAEYPDLEMMDHPPPAGRLSGLRSSRTPGWRWGIAGLPRPRSSKKSEPPNSMSNGWMRSPSAGPAWAGCMSPSLPVTGTGSTSSTTPHASSIRICRSRTSPASKSGKRLWSARPAPGGPWTTDRYRRG